MRLAGRFLLAAGAGVLVLLAGVLGAMVLGGFALLERTASPSGGFLILEFVAIAVLICTPMSIAAACWVLFRAGRNSGQVASSESGLFLSR
jgi:hypothetical protein